jgi:hypothetical protein
MLPRITRRRWMNVAIGTCAGMLAALGMAACGGDTSNSDAPIVTAQTCRA